MDMELKLCSEKGGQPYERTIFLTDKDLTETLYPMDGFMAWAKENQAETAHLELDVMKNVYTEILSENES